MTIKRLNKKTEINRKKIYTKTKLNIFVYLLVIFYVLLMTGCKQNEESQINKDDGISHEQEINQWFPALWINGPDYTYQPTYANKTRLSKESRLANTLYFTSAGIGFTIESNDPIKTEYWISKVNGEVIESASLESRLVQSDQSHLFDIIPGDYTKYNLGETYNLEIAITINGQEAYYYLDLYYNDVDGNLKSVEKVYNYLKNDLKAQDISFLNIPRFWINVKDDGTAEVRSEFTGATRLEEGFDYLDYVKIFSVDIVKGSMNQESQYMVNKQRYFYSNDKLGWSLGEQFFIGDDTNIFKPYIRKLLTKDNNDNQLIYSDQELYIYNDDKEELKEIYRIDAFDSDYTYDEYQRHKIQILNLEENGDVYFAVLGYINDGSDYSQKNGISFYKYTKEGLVNINFVEKEGTVNYLESYLANNSYYNTAMNRLYFFEKQSLYMFDLLNNSFTYLDAYLKANFNSKSGVLSWQGVDNKFNGTIFVVDLNEEKIQVKDLYQTGVYKRLLGDTDKYIFVGDYYVEDTYEALNGKVTYPFSKVNVYDFKGQVLASYDHLDYGENIFFSEVYFDAVTSEWKCDLIERQIKNENISKNSRISFVQNKEPIILDAFDWPNLALNKGFEEEVSLTSVYAEGLISTHKKDQDIIFSSKATLITNNNAMIQFVPHPKKDVYKIVDSKDDVYYTSTFIDALQTSKEKRDYKIYFSQYLTDGTTEDELIFESSALLSSQYLDDVVIIPQRPELPRGCEVTSLSILLDYYSDDAPDKMELASELKSSSIEYKVIDGFVNYSNMHYEFAGSMSDTSKPGLGVYIEPIRELAENYTNYKPTNITGSSFEQLLTFVSNKQPVLIVIPNRYQAVANYGIEVWKTNSGYMEVTYQEHSVVVMGFDENYVYYSDPSKGILDKKSIESFKSAWESIGQQGLVILE